MSGSTEWYDWSLRAAALIGLLVACTLYSVDLLRTIRICTSIPAKRYIYLYSIIGNKLYTFLFLNQWYSKFWLQKPGSSLIVQHHQWGSLNCDRTGPLSPSFNFIIPQEQNSLGRPDTENSADAALTLLINITSWLLGRVISPKDRNCSYFLIRLVDYCGAGIRPIRCSVSGSYVIDDDTCLCTAWFSLFIFSSNYSFSALYHYLKRLRHDSRYIYK